MRENTVKAKWRAGQVACGGWLSIPSSYSAEIMAHQGFDYLCVDIQHGIVDYADAVGMLTAISTTATMPFVRVPWNEPGIIGRVLDAGALGVIIPMVNTAAEARAAAAACRYAPEGRRSYGPGRVTFYAGDDYFQHANREVACIPMVETVEALGNLDEILAVPGIDAVYVGPSDMSVSLGLPPRMDNGGAFEEARLKIAAACKRAGVVAGIHANAGLAAKHAAAGYQLVTVSSDTAALAGGAARDREVAMGSASASGRPADS